MRLAALACKHILGKLQTLSDQPASMLRTDGMLVCGTHNDGLRTREGHALGVKSARHSTSVMPAQVGRTHSHADELDLSLYHYYRPRMAKAIAAEDLILTESLLKEAQEDYLEHVGRKSDLHFDDENAAIAYLLRELVGVPAEIAAARMKTRTQAMRSALSWVRNTRRRNGRDEETGRWREVSPQRQRVYDLRDEGLKQREIAERVGISRSRVAQILTGR